MVVGRLRLGRLRLGKLTLGRGSGELVKGGGWEEGAGSGGGEMGLHA